MLLDVSSQKISGFLISLDDQKKIRKEKSWENFEKRAASRSPLAAISAGKVIVSCEPELAFKIFISLSMKRENCDSPIERTELENLMAQAVSRIFNHYRREASRVLGVDELDTILANSEVSGFEIDGHKVINPLGFRPQEIRAVVKMTFTSRETFERVKSVKKNGDFFFTEKGQSQAAAVEKINSRRADFLTIGPERSYFYAGDHAGNVRARREIKWSTGALTAEIRKNWALNENAARDVYEYYANGKTSPLLKKYFGKIFFRPVKELLKQIKSIKTSVKVYVDGNIPLDLMGISTFQGLPLEGFMQKSGFAVDTAGFASDSEAFRQFASFFEFYYDSSDSEINGWLKRRLNWLGSSV